MNKEVVVIWIMISPLSLQTAWVSKQEHGPPQTLNKQINTKNIIIQ